ncbi:MAG: permease-like cell division protein FtsX [Bacteroidales bacterium]|nr:permease-like cell division protein FtsX [Bacteroidales bacterium]
MAKKKHRHHPGRLNSFTACISTAMVLTLVGIIACFGLMANSLERSVKENFTVQVLLDDSLSQGETKKLMSEIGVMPYAKEVSYISKEEATKAMIEDFGLNPNEVQEGSPYPAMFEVYLKAEYTEPDSLTHYMEGLKKAMGVTDVVYPNDLMEQINDNIRSISIVLLVFVALLGIISVSLINNTMRLNIAQRRHSIQTMKLVGANWGFIRRPFLWRAAGIGLVASILAIAILAGAFFTLFNWDPDSLQFVTPLVMCLTAACVFVFGIVLTVVCAFFSVNKHLSMSRDEAALY